MDRHAGGDANESGRMAKCRQKEQRTPTLVNPTAITALSRRGGTITCSRGGRTRWAQFEFTRINIEPIILRKEIEDLREVGASRSIGG
jgi:hypothetical protein